MRRERSGGRCGCIPMQTTQWEYFSDQIPPSRTLITSLHAHRGAKINMSKFHNPKKRERERKTHRPAFKKHNTAQHRCHCRDRGVQKPINSANLDVKIKLSPLALSLFIFCVYISGRFQAKRSSFILRDAQVSVCQPTPLCDPIHWKKKEKKQGKNEK